MQHIDDFPVGTHVVVSNGEPQPPARFNRKLAYWQSENYTGTVCEAKENRLCLTKDSHPDNPVICFRYWVDLNSRLSITVEPGFEPDAH